MIDNFILLFGGLIFTTTFACGAAYQFAAVRGNFTSIISHMDQIGRGFLLGLACFHFLPEGIDKIFAFLPLNYFYRIILGSVFLLPIIYIIKPFTNQQGTPSSQSVWVPFLVLVLLSIHSFSEGFVLSMRSTLLEIITVTLAVLLHKASEAIAFSVTVRAGNRRSIQLAGLFLFSLLTPLGVLFGKQSIIFTSFSQIIFGYIDLFAAALFIYLGLGCRMSCRLPTVAQTLSLKSAFYGGLLFMAILAYFI